MATTDSDLAAASGISRPDPQPEPDPAPSGKQLSIHAGTPAPRVPDQPEAERATEAEPRPQYHKPGVTMPGRNGGTLRQFTSEGARLGHQRRLELARQAALRGLQQGVTRVSDVSPRSWREAWQELAAVQAEKAVGGDTPAFNAVGRAAGLLFERAEDGGGGAPAADSQDTHDLRELLAAFRAWRDGDAARGAAVRAAAEPRR